MNFYQQGNFLPSFDKDIKKMFVDIRDFYWKKNIQNLTK